MLLFRSGVSWSGVGGAAVFRNSTGIYSGELSGVLSDIPRPSNGQSR
jgi:hypothetical protein